MSRKKVTLRIGEGEAELLKGKFNTDNQSEAIRLEIMKSLATEDSEKVKTLFPYIGKRPPRIGNYLPWDVKVVVNDINGNLTNLYMVIRDRPSDFVRVVMKLPYSEVVFEKCKEDLKSGNTMSDLN